LLEAFLKIRQTFPEVRLIICGEGTEKNALQKIVLEVERPDNKMASKI